jgi:branched-chain amino acid transport system permease protein
MAILFDGLAFGSLLFLVGIGLSVTMGLMNFVNLAHGAFAALGGYLCVSLMAGLDIPFLVCLPIAFLVMAMVGVLLERSLYRRLYGAPPLEQVLFTIGLTFMAMAAMTWLWGPTQQPVRLPDFLTGQVRLAGIDLGIYRLFLMAVVAVIALALTVLVERTLFGARMRAAVDHPQAAAGLGIDVDRVFTLSFALGSGLAGLGGALGIEVLGLDPGFPIKFLAYFLLVVTVGGAGSIPGTLIAALALGVVDIAGKYYLPQAGAFAIYTLMVLLLVLFPHGICGRKA